MIKINITKAKEIGNDIRRANRADEFRPYDEIIAMQIPGADAVAAEAARQAIREKYEAMQAQIDAAMTLEGIKSALGI